jgi:dephospho-CoA kinase
VSRPGVQAEMLVLGLTGGIGTGKSTVSSMFSELGAELIDADEIAHDLLAPGGEGASKVKELFGDEFIDGSGGVRRRELGKVVFSDPERRRLLERALHPLIIAEIQRRVSALRDRPDSDRLVVVVDAPVLLEAGARDLVDKVVVVAAEQSTQVARLKAAGRLSDAEIRERIASQMPVEQKAGLADFVVRNDGTLRETRLEVERLWRELTARTQRG